MDVRKERGKITCSWVLTELSFLLKVATGLQDFGVNQKLKQKDQWFKGFIRVMEKQESHGILHF